MSAEASEWTVGRRVGTGFGIGLVLVAAVTIVAWWALGRTVSSYEKTLNERKGMLLPAVQMKSDIRGANVDYLRYLLEGEKHYAASADSGIRSARATAVKAQTMAEMSSSTVQTWQQLVALLDQWAAGVDSSIAARGDRKSVV